VGAKRDNRMTERDGTSILKVSDVRVATS